MTGEDEPDRAGSPLQQTEHRERRERASLEVLHQEADGKVRGDPAAMLPTRTWDRIPLPRGPNSSGSLYTPAARMIGVARRNENRAASSCESPRTSPATIVIPERLTPAIKAKTCDTPMVAGLVRGLSHEDAAR